MNRVLPASPAASALLALALAFATIAGAWIFQWAGYPPCDLCLEQRYAYYAGVPLAALAFLLARGGLEGAARVALGLFALMFLANAGLALYHSGVEWKLWQGPTACSGSALPAGGDLLQQLQTVHVVRCDDVGLRVFGLTLANYNILISAVLAAIGARAALRWP